MYFSWSWLQPESFPFLLLASLNICFRSHTTFSTGRRGLRFLMTKGCITHWHGGNKWIMANSLLATENFWLRFLLFCKCLSLANVFPFIHEISRILLLHGIIAWINVCLKHILLKKNSFFKKIKNIGQCFTIITYVDGF